MNVIHLLLLSLATTSLIAQDHDVSLKFRKKNKGYTYDRFSFPDGMKVMDLDRKPHILKTEGLTLIQVFSLRSGAGPEQWNRVRDIEQRYKEEGLKTIAVNFENGSTGKYQYQQITEFFSKVKRPEFIYYDPLGYVIDFLNVSGFPMYYLVDTEGEIIFRTLGDDPEGVDLLETEIQNQIAKKTD